MSVLRPVVVALLGALFAATSASAATNAPKRLQVVTTVSPITSLVATVAGGRADVTGIVPEGTNSHTFEPAPSTAEVLSKADVVYMNGLNLEEPTRKLAAANLRRGAAIVQLGPKTITKAQEIYDFSFPRSEGNPNPHLWTNPPYARRYAELVAADLARRDPSNAAAYRRNLATLVARIELLSTAVRTATATVPAAKRKLLTYHDSFPYFAREYGWKVIGAIQPADFADPTAKEVAALIQQVRREGVPAIFGSEVFPSPVLAQIGKEAGVRYVDTLRDDDLPGNPGDPEHSWIGLMKADLVTMVTTLGGDASAIRAVASDIGIVDTARYAQ